MAEQAKQIDIEFNPKEKVKLIGSVDVKLEGDKIMAASLTVMIDGARRNIEIARNEDGEIGIQKDSYNEAKWVDSNIRKEILDIVKQARDNIISEQATEKYLGAHYYETREDIEV